MDKWQENEKEFKKGFKKSEKKDETKKVRVQGPKKNMTAYNLFCSEERVNVKNDHPDLSNKDVFTHLGARWKKLKESDPVRFQKYERLANEDKERYQKEKDSFVPSENESSKKSLGPKKAQTSYMFFCGDERKVISKENPELNAKDVLVELGVRWKKLKENDAKKLKHYEALAEKDKKRYESEKSSSSVVADKQIVEETVVEPEEPVQKVKAKAKGKKTEDPPVVSEKKKEVAVSKKKK